MSQCLSRRPALETCPVGLFAPGPSEAASATEHQAALDATLCRREQDSSEVVLELESGELRLRRRD